MNVISDNHAIGNLGHVCLRCSGSSGYQMGAIVAPFSSIFATKLQALFAQKCAPRPNKAGNGKHELLLLVAGCLVLMQNRLRVVA